MAKREKRVHELLAMRPSLEREASTVMSDLKVLFEKKAHLFEGNSVTFTPYAEDAEVKEESHTDVQSTIDRELAWAKPFMANLLDCQLQIATSNRLQGSMADIIMDDEEETVIAKNVPASHLLELERFLGGLHELVFAMPTHDPAKGFQPAPSLGAGYFEGRPVESERKVKSKKVYTLAAATERHPAQAQLVDEDIPTGVIRKQYWSAAYTPAAKADMLTRIDALLRAIRAARMRANDVIADTTPKIGDVLLTFVFGSQTAA